MTDNPLQRLYRAGQSIWLDYIDRSMLHDGRLAKLIEHDALVGMTSNPTIFEKALAEGAAYDAQISSASPDLSPSELFELIETEESVTLSREAAADRLRAIADQLSRHNELAWVQEGLKTSVKVPDEVELKVEIEVKEGGGGELEVEIHW